MFEAQYILGADTVFSPWISRSGDNLIAKLEIISNPSSRNMIVELYEKNHEDPGPGTAFGAPVEIDTKTVGVTTEEFSPVKELVRYRFKISSGTGDDRILFRMLSLTWFDDVKA